MKWRRYFKRNAQDEDLSQELEHYVAEETEDNIARGMDAEAARFAAIRKIGNQQAIRETVYEMNSVRWIEVVAKDLRYGLRQLWRRPGFASAAILSLALGIGANTAIFTLVDQTLLRLLPVRNAHELVQLRVDGLRPGGNSGDGVHTFPYPTYLALRDQNTVFSGVTGQRIEAASLVDDRSAQSVTVAMVAGNYFDVLGVRPHLGRMLTPDDDRHLNGHPVAVLQYDFWKSQFEANPNVVGGTVRLNGTSFTVVGVAAAGFEGTNVGFPVKIFVPVAMRPTITPTNPRLDEERMAWFYPFARLKPGVTLTQAEAAMKALYRQRQNEELGQSYFSRNPETREPFLQQTFSLEDASRGESGLRGRFQTPLILLQCLAAAVLLIACANIAGLLLARGAASQRDLAIRRAIGASRGRIVGQLFTESVLLATVSAIAAVFVGTWVTRLLIALLLPTNAGDLSLSAAPDLRVLAFTLAVTGVTVILFGLLPAWQNSQVAPVATMRETSGTLAGGRTHVRVRKIFVGLQIGLSAILLLGAGLFIRSLDNLRRVDLGLQSDNIVTFLARPAVPYDDARKVQAYGTLIRGLAGVRGVVAVGASRNPLFTGGRQDGALMLEDAVNGTGEPAFSFFNSVTPGFFEALEIPIRAGAAFDWRDWGSGKRVALVNEVITATYFKRTDPMDRMIGQGTRAATDRRIVGVFGNARYHDVRGEVPPQTYMNLDSVIGRVSSIHVYARVSGDPGEIMPMLREEARRIDPNIVISGLRTLDDQIDASMSNERMLSFLSIAFALLATILAVVGVHGVLVFQIARRTKEIGVRMALGAGRGLIVGLVAREMALAIVAGLAAGVITAYACGRYIQSQLFEMRADDPLVFGLAVAVLFGAAGIATLIPAFRASRVEIMRALRSE